MVEMAKCDVNIITNALGIQQIGPRTVIVPADPIIWSAKTSYEYLTLVASTDFGQAYVSKKDVPAGTPLTNREYWIPAATFNAQLAEVMRQLADKASTADLTALKESLEESIAAIGTVSGVVDNDKGFVQDSTSAVMLPGVGAPYTGAVDLYALASVISSWGNGTLKLGYDNANTFHYTDDGDGTYTPYMPTAHKNGDYLPIDCATFTQMVANNIIGPSSPYSGSAGLNAQGQHLFQYLDPKVIKYWSYQGGNAGRMLTWQYAKYLYDRGLLETGNFTPKPGMHVFIGDKGKWPDRFLGIHHCAIITNVFTPNMAGTNKYYVVDCGGVSSSPTKNTFMERVIDYTEIVAGFTPTNYGMTQNAMTGFNYLLKTDEAWSRVGTAGIDHLFNTTAAPITFHYKSSYANDTDGNKGGIDTDITLSAYSGFNILRCGTTVQITNGNGLRVCGENFPGIAMCANEVTFNGE